MPQYRYECQRKAGGCGQEFSDFKPHHALQEVMCPNCMMYGGELYHDVEEGGMRYRIRRIFTPPNIVKGIDSQDGRVHEPVEMPGLLPGPDGRPQRVSSRQELEELKRRTREEIFRATDGDHSVMKEFLDERTGKIVMEKVTTTTVGMDIGEIHPVESVGEGNKILSRFPGGEGKTLEQHEAEIAKRVGPPERPGR